jgi:hypothetical protein
VRQEREREKERQTERIKECMFVKLSERKLTPIKEKKSFIRKNPTRRTLSKKPQWDSKIS